MTDASAAYLRSTHVPRTLASLQAVLGGLDPGLVDAQGRGAAPPTVVHTLQVRAGPRFAGHSPPLPTTRVPCRATPQDWTAEEYLSPNGKGCPRLRAILRAGAAAIREQPPAETLAARRAGAAALGLPEDRVVALRLHDVLQAAVRKTCCEIRSAP